MPTGSSANSGMTAMRSANSVPTLRIWSTSRAARRRSSAEVGLAAATELLMIHAHG